MICCFRLPRRAEPLPAYMQFVTSIHNQAKLFILMDRARFEHLPVLQLVRFIQSFLHSRLQLDLASAYPADEDAWMREYVEGEVLGDCGRLVQKLAMRVAWMMGPEGFVETGLGRLPWLIRLPLISLTGWQSQQEQLLALIYNPLERIKPYRHRVPKTNDDKEAARVLAWIRNPKDSSASKELYKVLDDKQHLTQSHVKTAILSTLLEEDDDDDGEGGEVDPVQAKLILLLQEQPAIFERTKTARQSPARAKLCAELKWSHEQVEGWAIMRAKHK